MKFSLNSFIKTGLIRAVGSMADYQIILNAAGWHDKGVLTVEDLAQIQTAIDGQYNETVIPEEVPEEENPEESEVRSEAEEEA